MKEKIVFISSIVAFLLFITTFLIIAFNFQNWQEGNTAKEWLYSGLKTIKIEYEDFRFIDCKYEDTECITYTYEAYNYDVIDRDNIGDIDLWYVKETKYTIYISFELNKNFWNKFTRFIRTGEQLYKYTKCLDFDITIIK